jgi:hypothetical protein
MRVDNVSSLEMPGFGQLGIFAALGRGDTPGDIMGSLIKELPSKSMIEVACRKNVFARPLHPPVAPFE